jgi:two-component system response regulator TtrR
MQGGDAVQNDPPTVHVIDPDPQVRDSVRDLVSSMNLQCNTYAAGREFFAAYSDSEPGCIVLEVRIPDMSGLQIQRRLATNGGSLPMIFLSSQTDVSLAVELLRGGAVHYLQKPLRPLELINTIQEALAVDESRRESRRQQQEVAESIAVLSTRERDVLRLIAEGRSNLEIASDLNIALRTVELRRAQLMKKLGLRSPVALLRFALLANQGLVQPAVSRSLCDRDLRYQAGSSF